MQTLRCRYDSGYCHLCLTIDRGVIKIFSIRNKKINIKHDSLTHLRAIKLLRLAAHLSYCIGEVSMLLKKCYATNGLMFSLSERD